MKTRICDLKQGDIFSMYGYTYRVTLVTPLAISYTTATNKCPLGRTSFGRNSKQWVILKNHEYAS